MPTVISLGLSYTLVFAVLVHLIAREDRSW